MKFFVGILLAVLLGNGAQAQSNLGYIRVIVRLHTKGHYWPVQLYANSVPLGPTFSHESSGFEWRALTPANLSPNSKSTPIYAAYDPKIAAEGCEFDYEIDFSMDGRTAMQTFRGLHAPQSRNAGFIPLGLGCGRDGTRLCSSDAKLQQQIIQAANQNAKANYDHWKQDYNQRMQIRTDAAKQNADRLSNDLEQKKSPDFEEAQKKFLEERIKDWKTESDRMGREQMKLDSEPSKVPTEFNPTEMAKVASETAAAQKRSEAFAQLAKTEAGRVVVEIVELDKSLSDMIHREQNFLRAARTMPGSEAEVHFSEGLITSAEFLKREVLRGEHFLKTMKFMVKTGVDVGPSWLNIAIKLCEAGRGREFCIGHDLTDAERFSALCSLTLSNSRYWKKVKDLLEESRDSFGGVAIVRFGDSTAADGACGKMILPKDPK